MLLTLSSRYDCSAIYSTTFLLDDLCSHHHSHFRTTEKGL